MPEAKGRQLEDLKRMVMAVSSLDEAGWRIHMPCSVMYRFVKAAKVLR